MQAEMVANTGLTFSVERIGAEIDAAVIIETVPLPWISRMTVAMANGIRIAGIGSPAMTCAR